MAKASDGKPANGTRVSYVALVVSILSAGAAWGGVIWGVCRYTAEQEAAKNEAWQVTKLYDIIYRNTLNKDSKGMKFGDIQKQYNQAVMDAKPNFGKEELQTEALQKLLVRMIETQLIYLTFEDTYGIQRSEMFTQEMIAQGLQAAMTQQEMLSQVLHLQAGKTQQLISKIVGSEKGKYSVDELADKMQKENSVEPGDFHSTISHMLKMDYLVIRDGKLLTKAQAMEDDSIKFPPALLDPTK